MRADEAWGARWRSCAHPLSHRFMETAAEKGTLVVLAADLGSTEELVSIIHQVGPHIAALKTHVDMVEDFSQESWQEVVDAAHSHDLMLFEDRKFADIGRVSQTQMGGIYDIRS
ncbi:MAG: orotidine 5'-phosphate decarboxylase, partial [Arenicellales bacterium]|nr:orotidine 5'-phosphate decarboxylase [Arenicellales bacterium]